MFGRSRDKKTCTDDAAQDPGNAARETALQGVQDGRCQNTSTGIESPLLHAAVITGIGGGRLMMMTALNTKAEMVYGGQVTSGYCFATLNFIIGYNLIDCCASAFVEA